MPEDLQPGAATGEEQVQPAVSTGAETQQSAEELFFDATKVPEQLQPTFREMQAAWTKKTEEVAPWRKLAEEFGDPEEVRGFLSQLQDPQGLLAWWSQVAQELGITQEQLAALMQAEQQTPSAPQVPGVDPNDLNRPLTVQEFLAIQQQQEQQRQQAQTQAQEDTQVKSILDNLKVPDELKRQVLFEAHYQPAHLGYEERIKRGFASVQQLLDGHAAKAAEVTQQQAANAPGSLGGNAPVAGDAAPKTLEEARKAATAYIKGLPE